MSPVNFLPAPPFFCDTASAGGLRRRCSVLSGGTTPAVLCPQREDYAGGALSSAGGATPAVLCPQIENKKDAIIKNDAISLLLYSIKFFFEFNKHLIKKNKKNS